MSSQRAFWNFSVGLYGRPGVAAACLALQDRFSADVNIVLFCCWLAKTGRGRLTQRMLGELRDAIEPWHVEVIRALRGIRRRLKTPEDAWPRKDAERLREHIKKAELEAERIEQAIMTALKLPPAQTLPAPRRRRDAEKGLEAYFAALGVRLEDVGSAPISSILDAAFEKEGRRQLQVGKSQRRA